MGWIWPVSDHNVSNRWVVLDGLLDSGDSDAMGAALADAGNPSAHATAIRDRCANARADYRRRDHPPIVPA
ncbi:hypothetical protein [Nocardia lijiangensis]|uniref:hypothetical protein n=1 Tax=Nocardia lijiangensis TaxID=299618 RepID=UPI00082A84E2|nr:hypothetical protein [Nocardia lijiangensis]